MKQRTAIVFTLVAAGLLYSCSFIVDVDELKGDPCKGQECGPSLVFDGYDCGSCSGDFVYCSEEGLCEDDCEGLECGPSPTEGFDCGSCDETLNEECLDGVCHSCPAGLSGANCLDCEGGRYAEKSGLCWQHPPTTNGYQWSMAIDYCTNLDLGGYTDWTLPTVEDFVEAPNGLLDNCEYELNDYGVIDSWDCGSCANSESCGEMFGPQNNSLWSSSMYPSYDDAAWSINFTFDGDTEVRRTLVWYDLQVRCVRTVD